MMLDSLKKWTVRGPARRVAVAGLALFVIGCFNEQKKEPSEPTNHQLDEQSTQERIETATDKLEKDLLGAPSPYAEPAEFVGMLEAHNVWRRQVGSPALGWSQAASRVAQAWADELGRRDCQISHSPGRERRATWGENVFSYSRGGAYEGYRKTPEYVVDAWAGEGQWYDHRTNTCNAPDGHVCGHFTQVVSSFSTHVGCGRVRCKSAEVWVCNYSPPGNYRNTRPF